MTPGERDPVLETSLDSVPARGVMLLSVVSDTVGLFDAEGGMGVAEGNAEALLLTTPVEDTEGVPTADPEIISLPLLVCDTSELADFTRVVTGVEVRVDTKDTVARGEGVLLKVALCVLDLMEDREEEAERVTAPLCVTSGLEGVCVPLTLAVIVAEVVLLGAPGDMVELVVLLTAPEEVYEPLPVPVTSPVTVVSAEGVIVGVALIVTLPVMVCVEVAQGEGEPVESPWVGEFVTEEQAEEVRETLEVCVVNELLEGGAL